MARTPRWTVPAIPAHRFRLDRSIHRGPGGASPPRRYGKRLRWSFALPAMPKEAQAGPRHPGDVESGSGGASPSRSHRGLVAGFRAYDQSEQQSGGPFRLDGWIGEPLPTLPIWLDVDLSIDLELESSYEETCRFLLIS
jgi:hypothetical protein